MKIESIMFFIVHNLHILIHHNRKLIIVISILHKVINNQQLNTLDFRMKRHMIFYS